MAGGRLVVRLDRPVAAKPALSAYGRLPQIEAMALSPAGDPEQMLNAVVSSVKKYNPR